MVDIWPSIHRTYVGRGIGEISIGLKVNMTRTTRNL